MKVQSITYGAGCARGDRDLRPVSGAGLDLDSTEGERALAAFAMLGSSGIRSSRMLTPVACAIGAAMREPLRLRCFGVVISVIAINH